MNDKDDEIREKPNYALIKPRASKDFKDPHRRSRVKSGNSKQDNPIVPVIRFKTAFRNTIYDVMKRRGWKQTDSDMDWDFHWADREWMFEVFDYAHLETWQRVNHFRNDRELCRKDLLIKNIKRQRRTLEKEKNPEAERFGFCPTTYVLPGEYALFVEEFKKNASNTTWIMKPIGKSQGRGIFLFQKLNQISKWRSESKWKPENSDIDAYVVQRYISNPLLVGGKKFDIRIYSLVTGFQPLTVYLYRNGFARFSATRYSALSSDMSNQFMHLTNVAIQKGAENYNHSTGCKWDLRSLKLYLLSRYGLTAVDELFTKIEDIVLLSLHSVQKIMINDKHCFELYGYDIMIDENLKPWLIEVNASPSLSANTKDDYNMKCRLLDDMLDIVDMEKRNTNQDEPPAQCGGFDLIMREKDVRNTVRRTEKLQSRLGCDIPRLGSKPIYVNVSNRNDRSNNTQDDTMKNVNPTNTSHGNINNLLETTSNNSRRSSVNMPRNRRQNSPGYLNRGRRRVKRQQEE